MKKMMGKKVKLFLSAMMVIAVLITGCGGSNGSAGNGGTGGTDNWPNKSIQLVVPFNAGGDTDFHARTYAKYLEPILGQSVVVMNVNGANGTAGTIQVRDSAPDGYTALFFHDSMLMNKVVGVSDFAHEALEIAATGIMDNSYILAVHSDSPYNTLDDLVAAAKANPGQIKYASSIGGYTYYVGVQLEEIAGVSFNIVDAGGGSERNAALLSKQIDTNVNPYGVMKPYIDSGDFRVLAVFSEERSGLFPDVPTAIEQGYNLIARRAYFLSFPKGTDSAIIEKMSSAMEEISQKPEYAQDIANAYGVEPAFLNTKETQTYLDNAMEEFMNAQDLILGK